MKAHPYRPLPATALALLAVAFHVRAGEVAAKPDIVTLLALLPFAGLALTIPAASAASLRRDIDGATPGAGQADLTTVPGQVRHTFPAGPRHFARLEVTAP